MKINVNSLVFCFALMIAISGCERDSYELSPQDSGAITEEALIDSYYQDMDDLSGVLLQAPSEDDYSGGRVAATITIADNRFACDGIVVTIEAAAESTKEHPQGVIVVDFGTEGCKDLRGNIRKGKLMLVYSGRRFEFGSTVVVTPDNYFINGVKLEGTRTTTNVTGSTSDAPKFNVVLANGKATFQDGTFALRQSNITVSWIRGANPFQDKLIIQTNSTASGVTRSGREYTVSVLKQLEYQRFCPIAVSGVKKYMIDLTKEISLDYGAGTCDKTVTVTVEGITRTISIG
jgi:hypothetical protein